MCRIVFLSMGMCMLLMYMEWPEDNLSCQSFLSTLFDTEFCFSICQAVWACASRDFPVSPSLLTTSP